MKNLQCIVLVLGFILSVNTMASALRIAGPHSERVHQTTIKASLDVESHRVTAEMNLKWKNTTNDTLHEIPFHLYLNAFSSTDTVFMRESGGGQLRGDKREGDDKENFGYVIVTKLSNAQGKDLLANWQMDNSVATLSLSEPLEPGQTIEFNMSFTSQLPKVFARSGHNGDTFNFVAQWFPKPSVYINGKWVNHRYHAHSEFFADFGSYDVTLTVPTDYVVGATGFLADKQQEGDLTRHHYVAEDVHDFVWTADKNFAEANQQWQGINIRLLYQEPLDEKSIQNQFDAAIASFEWFEKYVGAYPYSTMTLVQPPEDASGAGGMEYPTLVTTITDLDYSSFQHSAALVTIHEIGHNYWQGILASNEFEESWMDEGINSYTEGRILAEAMKRKNVAQFAHLSIELPMVHHASTARTPTFDPVNTNSWSFINSRAYGTNSYSKPATILNTVERVWGVEKVDLLLTAYYQQWAFKHPNTKNFLDVAKTIDVEMAQFLDDAINTTKTIDFTVVSLQSEKKHQGGGYRLLLEQQSEVTPEYTKPSKSDLYSNTVTVAYQGELTPPSIEVLLTFEDGSEETHIWQLDANKQWKTLRFESEVKLVEAIVDPRFTLLLDKDLSNNIKKERSESNQAWRWVVSLLQSMHHLINAFLPL